jgi:hypothetical protein
MSAKGHMDAPGSTAGCPLGIPVGDSILGSIKGVVKRRGSGLACGDKLCARGLSFDSFNPPRSSIKPLPSPGIGMHVSFHALLVDSEHVQWCSYVFRTYSETHIFLCKLHEMQSLVYGHRL